MNVNNGQRRLTPNPPFGLCFFDEETQWGREGGGKSLIIRQGPMLQYFVAHPVCNRNKHNRK